MARTLRQILPHGLTDDVFDQLDKLGENPHLGVRVRAGPGSLGPMVYSFSVLRAPIVFGVAVGYRFMRGEKKIVLTGAALVEDSDS